MIKKFLCNLCILSAILLWASACGGVPAAEAPAAEAPAAEAPATEAPATEAPATEAPADTSLELAPDANNAAIEANSGNVQALPNISASGEEYDEAFQSSVCPDRAPETLQEAFARFSDIRDDDDGLLRDHKPIYWFFHMNFAATQRDGQPVGCFRLYQSDVVSRTYIPIDGGGIIVDTCTINDVVQIHTDPARAEFGNPDEETNGYITCAMDIQNWAGQIRASLPDDDSSPTLRTNLENFIDNPAHAYDNFTMMANVNISKPVDGVVPLIFYPAMSYNGAPVALYLNSSGGTLTFPTANCSDLTVGVDVRLWYDYRKMTMLTPENQEWSLIQYVVEDDNGARPCGFEFESDPPLSPIVFDIQPTTLYIGYQPDGGHSFTGTIYSIDIDPGDSKPPVIGG